MNSNIRVAQISDSHLFSDPLKIKKNVNPDKNVVSVLDMVKESGPYDFMLFTGDITENGDKVAYERLAKQIDTYKTPTYFVPGNHDDLVNLPQYFTGKNIHKNAHIIYGKWQFILLNTAKKDCIEGYLQEEELKFLKQSLASYSDLYSVVVMHHPPIKSDGFMDGTMLRDPDVFLEILSHYNNVRAVLFGHVHQVVEELRENTLFLSAPSTFYQLKPHTKESIVDDLTPGFRWLDFKYNGNIKTGISRLPMSKKNVTT